MLFFCVLTFHKTREANNTVRSTIPLRSDITRRQANKTAVGTTHRQANKTAVGLRSEAHTALKCKCFTVEIFEVGVCKLYAHSAYFQFCITEMTCRRHFYIRLECIGISLLEVFKLCSPCEGTDNIYIYAVLCPLCCCNTAETSDALFSGSVGALTVVAEKTCA